MIESIILLVGAVVTLLLAIIVLAKNYRSITSQLLNVLALALIGWSVTSYISIHTSVNLQTLYWIKWVMFFVVVQNTSFFLLVRVFPAIHFEFWKIRNYVIFIIFSAITACVALSPYLFVDMKNGAPVPGPGMIFFILHSLFFVASGISLVIKYKITRGLAKTQIGYFLAGTLFMFVILPVSNFILPVFFKTKLLVILSPLYSIVFTSLIVYAIVKHRFLDIRMVVARTVSYLLLVALFGLIYSLLFAVISSIFISSSIESRAIAISTALALLMAFSFQVFRKEIERATDKFLYKDHYDSSKLLYDLTLVMASTLKFEDLSHQFLLTLIDQMRVSKGAIILKSDDKIFDVSHEGYSESPSYNENKVFSLIEQNKLLVFDELDESEIKSLMREMDISIAVDIATAGQQIGLFTLGGKLSGDIYTSEDIRIIEIIVPELAVAIKNSLSYDEISRFNVTLKDEIDEATVNLRQANIKLQELDKLKDEFVSVASHELRTPMTAIKSYLWMALNKSNKKLDPKVEEDIKIAYGSTERLLKLVQDMLTISRIEGKRLQLQKEEFNFNEISQQVYDILKISAKEKRISFILNISDKPIVITGDKEKLREVLQNIVGNALKFTPEKGKIGLTITDEKRNLKIDIVNSGSYIPEEELPKLFQKFNRLNIETTQKENAPVGTGLGLYITKQIVEMHNGTIDVTSDEKEGTTFHIKIPKI